MRQLEDDVADKLRRRAKANSRGMEDEVRHILRAAVRQRADAAPKLGTRIAARFKRLGLTGDLPELTGTRARAADLDL